VSLGREMKYFPFNCVDRHSKNGKQRNDKQRHASREKCREEKR
jgi:hypothetical protein